MAEIFNLFRPATTVMSAIFNPIPHPGSVSTMRLTVMLIYDNTRKNDGNPEFARIGSYMKRRFFYEYMKLFRNFFL